MSKVVEKETPLELIHRDARVASLWAEGKVARESSHALLRALAVAVRLLAHPSPVVSWSVYRSVYWPIGRSAVIVVCLLAFWSVYMSVYWPISRSIRILAYWKSVC